MNGRCPLPQGPLTDWILATLTNALETGTDTAEILVGDGIAPKAGGWTEGQPGRGQFIPYVVLAGGSAGPAPNPSMGDRFEDWLCNYQLRATGASRAQVDWIGDRVSSVLWDQVGARLSLDDTNWRFVDLRLPNLGAPSRTDATDPPYWEAADVAELRLSRGP